MKQAKTKFLSSALVLMLFGLLSKVVGAIYRIPLTSIITAQGMGLYQMVFPLYSLLLTLSCSSLPTTIAKLISENIAKNNFKQANRILRVSFILLVCFSSVCTLIILFGAKVFASLQGNKSAYICHLGLCPALIFVGLISGYKGYFQGVQQMTPTAISQFVEQVSKLGFGLYFAYILKPLGISYSVFGALLGVSASEVITFFFLFLVFIFTRKKREQMMTLGESVLSRRQTAKQIMSLSVIIMLGSLIMPLSLMIDSVLILNILKKIGYSVVSATTLFGLESGTIGSIVNMPVVLSLAVSTAVLPCVASYKAQGNMLEVREHASKAIMMTIALALPASLGCFSLAEPILKLLYSRSLSASEIKISIDILETASFSIFYLALLQVTSGLLQGIGKAKIPLFSLLFGAIIKVVLNISLISVKSINILGAEIATAVCYAFALIINIIYLKKENLIKFDKKLLLVGGLSVFVLSSRYIFRLLKTAHLNYYLAFFTTLCVVLCVYFFFLILLFKKRKVKSV